MNIAYIRVSSREQNIDRQVIKMKELGIEDRYIFIDKCSGKDFDRPDYQLMKRLIREGDVLYIDSIDRLGRNYDRILKEYKEITREIKADIICLDNPELFNSKKYKEMGDIGKLIEDQLLSLLAYIAESERKKMLARAREGIEAAKLRGVYKGRKPIDMPSNFEEIYNKWKNNEMTARKAMNTLGLKTNTFYRMVKDYEEAHGIEHITKESDKLEGYDF